MQAKEEVIFTIIVIVIVLVFLGILFLVMLARHNTRKNHLLFENEKIKKEFEKTLLNTQLEIQEQTLTHVSREIHDNIGQILSVARLQLNSLDNNNDIQQTDELIGKAISDLRALSHSLNTNSITENGFIASVKKILSQLEKTGKYETTFSDTTENFNLSDDHAIILFRIMQEILNNIVRHANATTIEIKMKGNNGCFEIEIEDNGCGFDTGIINKKDGGIGLKNIIARAKVIGAKVSLFSQLQNGTTIRITI